MGVGLNLITFLCTGSGITLKESLFWAERKIGNNIKMIMVKRMKFMKDQKMSFKEIKDEYKNTEGDPNVKAALRQRRMQMLQQGMMDSVPDADFVVRNPTHIACALKYNADEMESPMLLAKGTELIARKIIKIATEHGIPIIDNPPVARALFRMVEINQLIPQDLYKAVAEILLFVYNLKNNQNQGRIINNTEKNKHDK